MLTQARSWCNVMTCILWDRTDLTWYSSYCCCSSNLLFEELNPSEHMQTAHFPAAEFV
jgi:hypothetical protein